MVINLHHLCKVVGTTVVIQKYGAKAAGYSSRAQKDVLCKTDLASQNLSSQLDHGAMVQWLRRWIYNPRVHVQNYWVTPRWTQPFILQKSIKGVRRIFRNLVLKSKQLPYSGSAALRQLNPIDKKRPSAISRTILKLVYQFVIPNSQNSHIPQTPQVHDSFSPCYARRKTGTPKKLLDTTLRP